MPSSCLSLDCHSSWHSRLFIKSSKKAAELQWGHWLETRTTHTVDVTLLALWRVWQWTPWRHSAHGGRSPKWLCFQLAVVSMLRPLLFLKLLIWDQMQSTSIFANFPNIPWPLSPHCLWPLWSLQISKPFREQSHLKGVTWSLLDILSFGFHISFTGKSQHLPPSSLHPSLSTPEPFLSTWPTVLFNVVSLPSAVL